MKISSLFQIFVPLLQLTSAQQVPISQSQTSGGNIGERTWDFPPHSKFVLPYDDSLPYNHTLDGFRGYEVGCDRFLDKDTNNIITPIFGFHYAHGTKPIRLEDCTPKSQEDGSIIAECPQLRFRHTNNVEVDVVNESGMYVLGQDCDAGT